MTVRTGVKSIEADVRCWKEKIVKIQPGVARIAAICAVGLSLTSCAEGPSPDVIRQLGSGYHIEAVNVTFMNGVTVSVTDLASLSEGDMRAKVQSLIGQAVKSSLNEAMTGPLPARGVITIKYLNCAGAGSRVILGGFDQLHAQVSIIDAKSAVEVLPSQLMAVNTTQGFGSANVSTAKKIDPTLEEDCPFLLALELGKKMRGASSAKPMPYIPVVVPSAR